MVKIVSEIAREYGVTEQTIYKRIKRLSTELAPWLSMDDNGLMVIDVGGIGILTKGLTKVGNGKQSSGDLLDNDRQSKEVVDNGCLPENDLEIRQGVSGDNVDVLVSMLQRELDVKNKTIEDLMAVNKDLTVALVDTQKILAQAQALHAGSMAQLLTNGEVKETPITQEVTDVKIVGWFKRVFGRKG